MESEQQEKEHIFMTYGVGSRKIMVLCKKTNAKEVEAVLI